MALIVEFDSSKELDNLMEVMKVKENALPSDIVKAFNNTRSFLKQINDSAFEKGFNRGLDFKKKIDKEIK